MHRIIGIIALVLSHVVWAEPPIIVDPQTGKYLGNLSANKLDPNSINNELGRYGNPYSPDSIHNTLGKYGNPYSSSSVNNPYAVGSGNSGGYSDYGLRGYDW